MRLSMFRKLPFLGATSTAINSALNTVKTEIKEIINVLFPFLAGILAIAFVATLIWQGIEYKRNGSVNWTLLLVLLICLIICGTGATMATSLAGW